MTRGGGGWCLGHRGGTGGGSACRLSSRTTPKGCMEAGSYLLSHTLEGAVPSAQESLTSVFGMGTGGTSPLSPPAKVAETRTVEGGIGVPAFCQPKLAVHPKVRISSPEGGGDSERVKSTGQLVRVRSRLAAPTRLAYQPRGLQGSFRESWS